MFTLEQLICFKSVFENKSFSKAGIEVGKSRSTVRERVVALEDILGFELFVINGKTAEPTSLAQSLYPRASNLVRQSQEFASVASAGYEDKVTTVTLHHDDLIPIQLLADIDAAITEAFPHISVNWLQRDRETSFRDIDNGEALLSIMPGLGRIYPTSRVGVINLGTYSYAAFASAFSPINDEVGLADLASETLLITEHAVRDGMRYANISNLSHIISSNDMLLEKLKRTGWTILSCSNARQYVESGELKEIRVREIADKVKQEMVLFYPLSVESGKTNKRIIDIARECALRFSKSEWA